MNVVHAHLVLNGETAHCRVLIASGVVITCCHQSIPWQYLRLSSQVPNFLEMVEIKVVAINFVKLFVASEMSGENSDATQVRVKLRAEDCDSLLRQSDFGALSDAVTAQGEGKLTLEVKF